MKRVPVFPLPNVVFFPTTTLPLHIFEPRYRQVVTHALERDRLIAVALLKPGWEKDYHGNPDYYSVATVGRITEHKKLDDGRYHILLEGLERVLLHEADSADTEPPTLYRSAWAVSSPEKPLLLELEEKEAQRVELESLMNEIRESMGSREVDPPLSVAALSFEGIVNHIAGTSDISHEVKQTLLELDDWMLRARALNAALRERLAFWRMLRQFRRLAPEDALMN
jgi:Lon protease-like protein